MSEFAQGMLVGVTITLGSIFIFVTILVLRRIGQQKNEQDQRVNDRR